MKSHYIPTSILILWFLSSCQSETTQPKGAKDSPSDKGDNGVDTDRPGDESGTNSDITGDTSSGSPEDTNPTGTCREWTGVDILVVIDNSSSMAEEQQILSSSIYTLINNLTHSPQADWPFSAVTDIRFGVTTTDLGLQFGESRSIAPTSVDSCRVLRGDDGQLLPIRPEITVINVESGQIDCTENHHCPAEFTCINGSCIAPGSIPTVNCSPTLADGLATTETSSPNDALATQAACLVQQGTYGCGVEQQLEASVRSLETNPHFLSKDHALAVIIVTDEEDCSIRDQSLFSTEEWTSGASHLLNVACNYPPINNTYLFDADRYRDTFVSLKGGESGVVFAAIVGVPPASDARCEGDGEQIQGCLNHTDMQIDIALFETMDGYEYTHLKPACTRTQGAAEITAARPGRRYVEVAELFGKNGYISSICNSNWSPAMTRIAEIIARQIDMPCEK